MSDYVTAIGLDVHARSIKAFALNPMTGECERASFGYDPAAVAEWALGFESPRCVYESGVTGFHLCHSFRYATGFRIPSCQYFCNPVFSPVVPSRLSATG